MFASEAKAILALSRVERRISNQYLAGVHVGTIPVDVCAFDGIKCLKPAHLLVIEDTKVLPPTPYWNLSFTPDFTMSRYDAR
jgi:asparagine synthetase B (glutamine-hydrolysing)